MDRSTRRVIDGIAEVVKATYKFSNIKIRLDGHLVHGHVVPEPVAEIEIAFNMKKVKS